MGEGWGQDKRGGVGEVLELWGASQAKESFKFEGWIVED